MSQFETIMLVLFGFAVALLVVLFIGRGVWLISTRLHKRRIARGTPTTIAELKSENDRLKAETAISSHKLELRIKDLKTRLAEQTAEVSRNRNRIERLTSDLKQRDGELEDARGKLDEAKVGVEPLEAELAKRTQNTQKLREDAQNAENTAAELRRECEQLMAEINRQEAQAGDRETELQAEIAQRDAEIEKLRSDLLGTDRLATTMVADVADAQRSLQKRIDELAQMSSQISEQRNELAQQQQAFVNEISSISDVEKQPDKTGAKTRTRKSVKKTTATAKTNGAEKAATGSSLAERLKNVEKIATLPKNINEAEDKLQQKFDLAQRETSELRNDLAKLDTLWSKRLNELENIRNSSASKSLENTSENTQAPPPAPPAKAEAKPRPAVRSDDLNKRIKDNDLAKNVVSLADRMRSLSNRGNLN